MSRKLGSPLQNFDLDLAAFRNSFVIGRLGHAMVNVPTKFEVPTFSHYGYEMRLKCTKWGGLGSSKVIGNVTIR